MASRARPVIYRLSYERIEYLVLRTPVVLLAVDDSGERRVPPQVVSHFASMYGANAVIARIGVHALPDRKWILPYLESARPEIATGDDLGGLYLFLGGKAVKFHSGTDAPSAGVLAFYATVRFGTAAANTAVDPMRAKAILECFEPIVREYIERRREEHEQAQLRPTERATSFDEACRVLRVGRGASRAEGEKAWRRARGEYSPDKVQHVSEAFFQLAHDKTLELDRAVESFRRYRGV
jgi:hypothetical protein